MACRKVVWVDVDGYEIDKQYFKGICNLLRDGLYTFDLPMEIPVREYLTEKWKDSLLWNIEHECYFTLETYIDDNFHEVLNTSQFQEWYNDNYYHGYEAGTYEQYKKVEMKKVSKGKKKKRMLKPNTSKGPIIKRS